MKERKRGWQAKFKVTGSSSGKDKMGREQGRVADAVNCLIA